MGNEEPSDVVPHSNVETRPDRSKTPHNPQSLLVAALLGLAISFLSSFFGGLVAVALMFGCVGVLYLLVREQPTDAGGASPLSQQLKLRGTGAFFAMSVLVGAALGGLSLLPVFPNTSLEVPWTGVFDPRTFGYGSYFHWYELLAATLIAGVACVLLFLGHKLFSALSFAVAAVGGAVTVFSAFGPYFSDPVPTFLGWSAATVPVIGLIALALRWFVRLLRQLRPRVNAASSTAFQESDALAPTRQRESKGLRGDSLEGNASVVAAVIRPPRSEYATDVSDGAAHSARRSEGATTPRRETCRVWRTVSVLAISLAAVIALAVGLTITPFGNPLFLVLIGLFIVSAIALCASGAVLLKRIESRRTVIGALSSAGVLTALLFAFLALRPESWPPEAQVESTHSTTTHPASPTMPTSETENSPAPPETPTLASEGDTKRVDQGAVLLFAAKSIKIESWGIRIAAKSVFSTWANVRVTTDQKVCEASLDVGESIVMSNRQSAVDDYDTWYEVVLESIEDDEATFAWAVGSGKAPAADVQDSCV